jgi:hypothetical protein
MGRVRGWLLLILLAAVFLRFYNLAGVPPGLTHDEADHGLDAWGVVNGIRPIYFTVGYGREPLFDYSTAVLMSFLGSTYLAGRLTAVFYSLILLSGTFAWVRRAFNERTALLTAAGLAVSFWPVMTARHALRSVTLPAMFVLAVYFFWQGLEKSKIQNPKPQIPNLQSPIPSYILAGLLLGVTFYTYLPARVVWVMFLLLLVYVTAFGRKHTNEEVASEDATRPASEDAGPLNRVWVGVLLMLLVAAAVGWPLFHYLATHPAAETRVEQLIGPLEAARAGDWRPLLANVTAGLGLLSIEGDSEWRYNIPGKPFLPLAMSVLFYVGIAGSVLRIAYSVFRDRQYAIGNTQYLFILLWLFVGLLPALLTGRSLSATRAIAAQPVLYLFVALGLDWVLVRLPIPNPQSPIPNPQSPTSNLQSLLPFLLLTTVFILTARDYFGRWANAPEVRVQYETALVTAIEYLNDLEDGGAVALSTTTPNHFHSPAVAFLTLKNDAVSLRWFDGRSSLLLPQDGTSRLIFTGFAPLHPALATYLEPAVLQETLPMRPDDLDRPLTVYATDGPATLAQWQATFDTTVVAPASVGMPVKLGEAAELLGYTLQAPQVAAGDSLRLLTLWQVWQPIEEAVLFTHVLGEDRQLVAQADRLDVPAYYWHPGDVFIQLHEFQLPADLTAGEYPLLVGLYRPENRERLPVIMDGTAVGDAIELPPLVVIR